MSHQGPIYLYDQMLKGSVRSIKWERGALIGILGSIKDEFDRGSPVIVPTDTVYGIIGPIDDIGILNEIFLMKERPDKMTLPVAVGSLDMIEMVARPDMGMMDILKENLPGPVTLIVPAVKGLPDHIVQEGKVAVRIPEHPMFHSLCEKFGPVALTSANIHGRGPILGKEDLEEQMGRYDLLMIEDPLSISSESSEMIDISEDTPMLLRKGKVNIFDRMRGHNG